MRFLYLTAVRSNGRGRYFQSWDGDRDALRHAYAEQALFSYQLHDVPHASDKSKVTLIPRAGHRNLSYASHRHGRKALAHSPPLMNVGRAAILEAFARMGHFTYGYGASFDFVIHRMPEMDDAHMLIAHGTPG